MLNRFKKRPNNPARHKTNNYKLKNKRSAAKKVAKQQTGKISPLQKVPNRKVNPAGRINSLNWLRMERRSIKRRRRSRRSLWRIGRRSRWGLTILGSSQN